MHWYWECMSWADWASFDEIDCPIYIQSIRPHRLSASYTHFPIIVKKYHCTDLQHHSPHDSQHSSLFEKKITTKCWPNRGDWVQWCFHGQWQALICASWHSNQVFIRGLVLVLFELIELIQRINVSSPTDQHIMAAEHVCWVVHSLGYCASGARTMLWLLAMLRWRILGWRRLRETSTSSFRISPQCDGNAGRGRVGWIWPSISEEMIDKLSKWLELLDCSSTASTVVMSNDCIDVSTSWNVLDT